MQTTYLDTLFISNGSFTCFHVIVEIHSKAPENIDAIIAIRHRNSKAGCPAHLDGCSFNIHIYIWSQHAYPSPMAQLKTDNFWKRPRPYTTINSEPMSAPHMSSSMQEQGKELPSAACMCTYSCCLAVVAPCYLEYETARLSKVDGLCMNPEQAIIPGIAGGIAEVAAVLSSIPGVGPYIGGTLSWLGPITAYYQTSVLQPDGSCCAVCCEAVFCYPCVVGRNYDFVKPNE
jgi:hypothetical protein